MSQTPPKPAGRKHFIWQCQKCGYAVVAKTPPANCEACGATQQNFVLIEHD